MAIAFHAFLLQLLLFFLASFAELKNPRKVYLVQMKVGGHRYGSSLGHQELLGEVLDDDSTVENAHIYSYKESFTGFSASLTQNERQKLMMRKEVLEVSRSRNLKLHTTRSWDLMNLTLTVKRRPEAESNLVVAVIDTGIWPYSDFFRSDDPPPKAWQNKCQNITCNNKIVGARSYYPEGHHNIIELENSVIDVDGHGTHVASIVAGKKVENAGYFGLAEGVARGGVPNAKIAIYKTCWGSKTKEGEVESFCPEDTALRAIEDAMKDEVDVISFSQGLSASPLEKDKVSWAFLRALEKGILTSTAAGNSGVKGFYSVTNAAPWVMTVAASTKDRYFETQLDLEGEDKPIVVTNTINTFETQDSFYPLLDETTLISTSKRELLVRSKEDPILSNLKNNKGKDVFFNYTQMTLLEEQAIRDEAKGAIIWNNYSDTKESKKLQFPIPSIFLSATNGALLKEYYKKDKSKHRVKIHKTEEKKEAEGWIPNVADLSSRGPNCDNLLENILKPDIAAPGLDIIAGWPVDVNLLPDISVKDYRHHEQFNIVSGTSMACPHATGLALYVKSFRPHWSPSAIKSAIMTTSTGMRGRGNEFAYGSGFINATKVLDPGLIYNTTHQDYIDYICKQGFNTEKLRSHIGKEYIDCSGTKKDRDADLNYPSMTARVDLNKEFKKIFIRNVTNVGKEKSTYLGEITTRGKRHYYDKIIVEPDRLEFSDKVKTRTFTVTVTGKSAPNMGMKSSFIMMNTWLTWTDESDSSRQVRSPIVIYSDIPKGSEVCLEFLKK